MSLSDLFRKQEKKPLGLYIHIPFCRSKCLYCDFCSIPHAAEERIEAYAAAMERESARPMPTLCSGAFSPL